MPTFIYKGLNKQGQSVSGTIEAATIKDVYTAVEKLNIFISDVKEADSSYEYKKGSYSGKSLKLVTKFTRALSNLLSAGIQLQDTLQIMLEQSEKEEEKTMIKNLITDIKSGKSFSEALSNYSQFQGLYMTMISTGEKLGNLGVVTDKLADYYEKKMEMKRKFVSALTYPMVVAAFAVVVIIIMFVFVMPTLLASFKGKEDKLPEITKVLIRLIDFMKAYWWLVGGVFGGIIYYFMSASKNPAMRKGFEKFILGFPLIKNLYRRVILSNFVWPFSLLIKNGVTIVDALEIIRQNTKIFHLKDLLKDAISNLREGGRLHETFKDHPLISREVYHMIAVGEKGEMLPKMLDKVIEMNDKETETLLERTAAMVEPLAIILLGVIIGLIVVAVIMPISQMSSTVE
jgi:type II secretory pathway component PulF